MIGATPSYIPEKMYLVWLPCGLDGPGIESMWGRDFPHPSRPTLGAHPTFYTTGTGSLSLG
jgi:hypothetical protein